MNRGHVIVAIALTLVVALACQSRLDPMSPLLPSGRGTWWGVSDPLSAHDVSGPFRLEFRFMPAAAGRLEITALGTFSLTEADQPLAQTEVLADWRRPVRITVAATPLVLSIEHPRWQPVVAFAGAAAPADVQVLVNGATLAATPVARRFRVRSSLPGRVRHLPAAALVTLLLLVVVIHRRAPARAARSRRRPVVVALIVSAHAVVTLWNVSHVPWRAGLDAEAHLRAVEIAAAELRAPRPGEGFQTYHPPLYPMVGALFHGVAAERGLQVLSALSGLALVVVAAFALGADRWRGLLLIAFAPVLLVAAPQISNELPFALAATALLVTASAEEVGRRRVLACGLLAAIALLIKYTGVPFAVAAGLALLLPPPRTRGGRARNLAIYAVVIGLLAASPYLERLRSHGDPFVGNWDDQLGHAYRQPPGVRVASYFFRFGAALHAHPFRARASPVWDSLYVSTVADGFGRLIRTDLQHALMPLLAWLGLPLMVITLTGFVAIVGDGAGASRREWLAVVAVLLGVGGLIRFNLELPYWSTAKGIFLLGLAVPMACGFERGRAALARRAPGWPGILLDVLLVTFAGVAVLACTYR